MIEPLRSFVSRRARRARVMAVHSSDELTAMANREGFAYFSHYARFAAEKQREFVAGVTAAGISISGKTVFDIGPGTADSLDAARAMGARKTWFIDEEPFFWRYATLKGHEGWQQNYTVKPYFPAELNGKVDFIWSKGSINCAQVNEGQKLGIEKLKFAIKRFDFCQWIQALKDLLTPTGSILLMPAMGYQKEAVFNEVYGSRHHWRCPDVQAFLDSYFARALIDNGFHIVQDVPYYTDAKAFPVGFLCK